MEQEDKKETKKSKMHTFSRTKESHTKGIIGITALPGAIMKNALEVRHSARALLEEVILKDGIDPQQTHTTVLKWARGRE